MTVFYNEKEIGNIVTNRSMTIKEALWSLGYDIEEPADCEKAYKDGFAPAYIDDNGEYQIDIEACRMVY